MPGLAERASLEVSELHRFFEDWFRGRVDESAFSRVADALAPGFRLISPGGAVLEREPLLASLRGAHGSEPGMRLWSEAEECRWGDESACLVQYREHQTRGGGTSERHSSALFVADEGAPNGVRWVHVHETWAAGDGA